MDTAGIYAAVKSHALKTGLAERALQHEPKAAPGAGVTIAVILGPISPVPARSGLASASARVEFLVRLYSPFLGDPLDDIDPAVLAAVDALFASYVGGFSLEGLVANVDLFGAHGQRLMAQPGYVRQDNRLYRATDITLPLIVNDAWPEVA
jgi:hypothetical protein